MKSKYTEDLIAQAEKLARQGSTAAQCRLHLLDLKRAGHSPSRTELDIAPQYGKRITPLVEVLSLASTTMSWM